MRASIADGSIPEVAIMRLNNYREPKPEDSSFTDPNRSNQDIKQLGSARAGDLSINEGNDTSALLENFQLEEIPPKMILIDQKVSEETHLIAYHSGKIKLLHISYFRGSVQPSQTYHRCR